MRSDYPPVIIFDFDGTIADSFDEAFLAANRIAHESGMRHAEAHDKDRLRAMSFRQMLREFHVPLLRIPRMLVRMRAELSTTIDEVEPIPGIPEVLRELRRRQLNLGIVTSNSRPTVDRFLVHHEINVFNFGSYSVGLWSKAKQLRRVIRENHLTPEHVYYVGDTQEDIVAGNKAGVHTVAVTWGYASAERLSAAQPQFVVTKPQQLLMIGEALNLDT